jgi:hypothetical protein
MAFAKQSGKCVDIRAESNREIVGQSVGDRRFDIQQRQGVKRRRRTKRPIVRPSGDRTERNGHPYSGGEISEGAYPEVF